MANKMYSEYPLGYATYTNRYAKKTTVQVETMKYDQPFNKPDNNSGQKGKPTLRIFNNFSANPLSFLQYILEYIDIWYI